jgi:hypothetical protein
MAWLQQAGKSAIADLQFHDSVAKVAQSFSTSLHLSLE